MQYTVNAMWAEGKLQYIDGRQKHIDENIDESQYYLLNLNMIWPMAKTY